MRITSLSTLIVISVTFFCGKCNDQQPSGGLDTCKDLPNIQFKNSQVGTDKQTTLKLISELAAAAKNDASTSQVISASGSLSIKSEFGKILKENISGTQSVSDDFWEQNITLTQLLCFTEAQSKRTDLTATEKSDYNKLLIQIISDRNEYLKQRGLKKNP